MILIVGGSATIGVFPNLWTAENAVVKNIWRFELTIIYIMPLLLISACTNWKSVVSILKPGPLFFTIINSFFLTLTCYTFIRSSELTLVSHTVCIGQAAGVALITTRILICARWDKLEAIGTAIVIGGAYFLMTDKGSEKAVGETNILMGDIIAALSCCSFAANLFFYDLIIRKSNVFACLQLISVFTLLQLMGL